jgi:hypothetical protein
MSKGTIPVEGKPTFSKCGRRSPRGGGVLLRRLADPEVIEFSAGRIEHDDAQSCYRVRLVVLSCQVVDSAGGWPADGGVVAVMVVAMEPACKCSGSAGF